MIAMRSPRTPRPFWPEFCSILWPRLTVYRSIETEGSTTDTAMPLYPFTAFTGLMGFEHVRDFERHHAPRAYCLGALERFPEKWKPVFCKKARPS